MDETTEEVAALQQLIDRSFERASEHLRSIMEPQRRLSADQVSSQIEIPAVLNLATVTAAGEPRISAVDGHFLHGRWYFTTSAESVKARHLAMRPAVSASYTPRDGFGVFCHGTARRIEADEHRRLLDHLGLVYGTDPQDWAAYPAFCIDAEWMTGFAMTDEEMKMVEAQRAEREVRLGTRRLDRRRRPR